MSRVISSNKTVNPSSLTPEPGPSPEVTAIQNEEARVVAEPVTKVVYVEAPKPKTMTTRNMKSTRIVEDIDPSMVFRNPGTVETVASGDKRVVDWSKVTETSALFDSNIQARPLMAPTTLDIKIKNHEYSYRWVEYRRRNGENVNKFMTLGFSKAELTDAVPSNPKYATPEGIICEELLLMKCHKSVYYAYLKASYRQSNAVFNRKDREQVNAALLSKPENELNTTTRGNFYQPEESTVNSILQNRPIVP